MAIKGIRTLFFPVAGRVVRDPATNIPQVACSNAGAELVVAVPLVAADFARVDGSLSLIQTPSISLNIATNHLLADGRAFILLLNSLAEMVAAIERCLYRVDAADLVELQRPASAGGRRTSCFVALCAHVWKLLARAVAESGRGEMAARSRTTRRQLSGAATSATSPEQGRSTAARPRLAGGIEPAVLNAGGIAGLGFHSPFDLR